MSKVYGLHIVELREGVTPAQFERFTLDTFLPALPLAQTPGVHVHLLRGERGANDKQYVVMFEFDDTATRDRYFPSPGVPSAELLTLIAPLQPLPETWEGLSAREKTDYLVLGSFGL